MKRARKDIIVLPLPTSPRINLFICFGELKSFLISSTAFTCESVNLNGKLDIKLSNFEVSNVFIYDVVVLSFKYFK